MKKIYSILLCCFLAVSSFAQVKVMEGPELNNEEHNKMNRMVEGENGAFYAYRIRTKGKGTSYFIEKFKKSSMKAEFSKEVDIPKERTKVLDIQYIADKVYVIFRTYDKEKETMSLNYHTVSSSGVVSSSPKELLSRKTDHYEFIDFDITSNNSKTKMAIKVTHKPNKDAEYKTDFVLFNGEAVEWTKTVNKYLKRSNPWFVWSFRSKETTGFLGLLLDDNDNIYYAYNDKVNKEDRKDERYNAAVEIIRAGSKEPKSVKLDLNPEYLVYDVKFSMQNNKLVVGGFFKDILERRGRDLVDVGVFSFNINASTGAIEGKAIKVFDEKILTALESNKKRARAMIYKVDYILPSGDDFYLVGEQYTVSVQNKSNSGFSSIGNIVAIASGANPFYVGKNFIYEYMDVIVAKINAKGEFEWVVNSPLRNMTITTDNPHVFKQYIATVSNNNVYLMYNEHPKNVKILQSPKYEPKKLKTQKYIHGSNMVFSKITPAGKMTHAVAFENETYCFAPIQERNIQFLPPQDAEIFVPGESENVIYIYTEDRGKGRFAKLTME